MTGYTEVELPHNNGSHQVASRGCGRIGIDKRANEKSSKTQVSVSRLPTIRGIDLLRNLHPEWVARFFWEEPVTSVQPRTFLLLIILASSLTISISPLILEITVIRVDWRSALSSRFQPIRQVALRLFEVIDD